MKSKPLSYPMKRVLADLAVAGRLPLGHSIATTIALEARGLIAFETPRYVLTPAGQGKVAELRTTAPYLFPGYWAAERARLQTTSEGDQR